MSWKLVGFSWLGFASFTILFQLVTYILSKRSGSEVSDQNSPNGYDRINNTAQTSAD